MTSLERTSAAVALAWVTASRRSFPTHEQYLANQAAMRALSDLHDELGAQAHLHRQQRKRILRAALVGAGLMVAALAIAALAMLGH